MGFLELARLKIKEMERDRDGKEVDPIEALDKFWARDILPHLSRLHLAGWLHDLSMCPLWNEVDRLWKEKPLDAEMVKQAMTAAIEAYERAPRASKTRAKK